MDKKNENKKDDYLYIILHIPKTGGMTLRKHIEENFKKNEIIKIYCEEDPKIMKIGLDNYLLNHPNKKSVKIIIGHNFSYGIHKYFQKKVRYITFIREPIEIPISVYNFIRTNINEDVRDFSKLSHKILQNIKKKIVKKGEIKSFGEIIEKFQNMSNIMTKTILYGFFFEKAFDEKKELKINEKNLTKAKEIISNFYFIGLNHKKEDLFFVYHILNIKKFFPNQNISKKYVKKNKELIIKLFKKNKYDIKLYEYALKLNKNFKEEKPFFNQLYKKIFVKTKIYQFKKSLIDIFHSLFY